MPRPRLPITMIECGCGCGEKIPSRVSGKSRKFVFGHNRRSNPKEYESRDMGHVTPCWIWLRSLNTYGYGIGWDGKNVPAHRMIYERHKGIILAGLQLDHLCRIRACVNPEHLEPVTIAENIRRGDQSFRITMTIADDIRSKRAAGVTAADLATTYNTHPSYVRQIARGEAWK